MGHSPIRERLKVPARKRRRTPPVSRDGVRCCCLNVVNTRRGFGSSVCCRRLWQNRNSSDMTAMKLSEARIKMGSRS